MMEHKNIVQNFLLENEDVQSLYNVITSAIFSDVKKHKQKNKTRPSITLANAP